MMCHPPPSRITRAAIFYCRIMYILFAASTFHARKFARAGIAIPATKIILIGPSNVGKTTLRKIFFEQENPLKLLNESLEPTMGHETTIYDIEGLFEVHDLGGWQFKLSLSEQQSESWSTENFDLFYKTDLIITMVDATDGWDENKNFWERVNFERQKICPNAHLMILFHKVDLLDDEKRQQLEWNISAIFAGEQDITAFTSSIVLDFFPATFNNFVGGFRQCITKIKDVEVKQLIPLYQKVDLAGIDPDVAKDFKQLIFHYAITQQEEDLAQIESLVRQYNIQ